MEDEIQNLSNAGQSFESILASVRETLSIRGSNEEVSILGIFYLLEKLLDGEFEDEQERLTIEELLLRIFRFSSEEFSDSLKFSFCVGYLSAIAYWFFGMNSRQDSEKMIKFAMDSDPDNSLFTWGYYFTIGDNRAIGLSEKVISDDAQLASLRKLGKLGDYLFDAISLTEKTLAAK